MGADGRSRLPVWRMPAVAVLVVAALAIIVAQPFHGAVLVSLTPEHGFDAGDLLAVPFLVAAGTLARGSPPRRGASPVGADRGATAPGGAATTRREALCAVPLGLALLAVALLGSADVRRRWGARPALLVAAGVVGAGVAGTLAFAGAHGRRGGRRRAPWYLLAFAAVTAGALADTAALPSGTVFAALAPVLLVASTRRPGLRAAHWYLLAATLSAANLVALADVAGLDVVMASESGGPARTVALGAVLTIGGLGDHLWADGSGAGDLGRPRPEFSERLGRSTVV